jgi:predicted HAD superfamily phosphohydrolase YqeG
VRSAYERLADRRDIPARLSRLGVRTAIIDVEPLIAPWDSPQTALDQGIADTLREASSARGLEVICFATNSARAPSVIPPVPGVRVDYVVSAHKPVKTAPYADLPRPGAVIGDQVMTDGILARHLGYAFLHFEPQGSSMPPGPRLLFACGQLLRPMLFGPSG